MALDFDGLTPQVDIEEIFGVKLLHLFVQDYNQVLRDGPWMIIGRYLLARKWLPSFNPFNFTLNTLLLWLHITDLPMDFFLRKYCINWGPWLVVLLKLISTRS